MNGLNARRIADLTITALERTAFVIAEPAGDAAVDLPPADRFARIAYSGPSSGHVYLAASNGFVRELTASLLGVEPEEIQPDQCEDALRELTNIVGGLVTLELGGSDRCLSLGLPEGIEGSDLPQSDGRVERCCLDSEGQRLEVIWAPGDGVVASAA